MKTIKLITVAVLLGSGASLIFSDHTLTPLANAKSIVSASLSTSIKKVESAHPKPLNDKDSGLIFNEDFDAAQPSNAYHLLTKHRHIEVAPYPLQQSNQDKANQAIRVTYQGYERGSERVVRSLPLNTQSEDMLLSFDVTFCEGFDFARGGKLHGLGPKKAVTGGNEMTQDGWSTRLMWRQQGRLQTYIYHHDKPARFGDTKYAKNFHFTPGQSHHIQLRTKLNTPDKADGLVQVWVDGQLQIEHDGLRLRTSHSETSSIQQLLFNTFHGGSSPDWAPRDEHGEFKQDCAYFDNFQARNFISSNI